MNIVDVQVITAIAALITSVATLIKVLQHEKIFIGTNDMIKATNGKVTEATQAAADAASAARASQLLINAHLDALTSAAQAFAATNLKPSSHS